MVPMLPMLPFNVVYSAKGSTGSKQQALSCLTYIHGIYGTDSSDSDISDGTINSIIGSSPRIIVYLTLHKHATHQLCRVCDAAVLLSCLHRAEPL